MSVFHTQPPRTTMPRVHRIISDNIDRIKTLCAHRKVKSIFAFGSVCTDRFSPSSDIDLLIAFEPMDYGDYADNFFFLAEAGFLHLEGVFSEAEISGSFGAMSICCKRASSVSVPSTAGAALSKYRVIHSRAERRDCW